MAQKVAVKPAEAPAQAVATRSNGLVARMAAKYGVDAEKMLSTLKATAFKTDKEVTHEQMMALLVVAAEYNLNPWTKEIFAFPHQGGIIPVIGVDGWIRIMNTHPQFMSQTFRYPASENAEIPAWIECVISRKDRGDACVVREYFDECKRGTGPWQSHPRRMLRHKALIQCIRIAFGFAGVYDQDEAERILDAIDVTPTAPRAKAETEAPQALPGAAPALINDQQVDDVLTQLNKHGIPEVELLNHFKVEDMNALTFDQVEEALEWIARVNG